VGQDLIGFTAQQQALNPFATMGGHHNQITFVLFGGGNDRF
jgi:hypothetical protein